MANATYSHVNDQHLVNTVFFYSDMPRRMAKELRLSSVHIDHCLVCYAGTSCLNNVKGIQSSIVIGFQSQLEQMSRSQSFSEFTHASCSGRLSTTLKPPENTIRAATKH